MIEVSAAFLCVIISLVILFVFAYTVESRKVFGKNAWKVLLTMFALSTSSFVSTWIGYSRFISDKSEEVVRMTSKKNIVERCDKFCGDIIAVAYKIPRPVECPFTKKEQMSELSKSIQSEALQVGRMGDELWSLEKDGLITIAADIRETRWAYLLLQLSRIEGRLFDLVEKLEKENGM